VQLHTNYNSELVADEIFKMSLPEGSANFADFSSQALRLLSKYEWVYNFKMIQLLFPENSRKVPPEFQTFFQGLENEASFHSILLLKLQVRLAIVSRQSKIEIEG
jgi:hypothetical protein